MPICSRSSTWACVLGASVSRASVASTARLRRRSAPEETSCFCRGDGAPFSTARFWEVGRYPWSRNARRRRARRGGRPRPRARQHRTTERCKTPSSVHWISPNRHRGTRTGAVLSAQVVVRRAQRALRYVSTSFSRRCRRRSCVFAASSSLAKTRGTSFFFVCWARGDFRPLTKSDAVPPLTLFWSRQPTAGFPSKLVGCQVLGRAVEDLDLFE